MTTEYNSESADSLVHREFCM